MTVAQNSFARSTRRPRGSSPRAGFTLIEVLATLLMLGIALPAVLGGFTAATAAVNSSRRQAEAAALGETQLNNLIATNAWQTTSQGTMDGANLDNHYQWSIQLSNFGNGLGVDATNIVQELDLQVTWTERTSTAPKSVTLSTLVYQSQNTTGASGTSGGIR